MVVDSLSLFSNVGGLSWEDLKAGGGDLMAGGWNHLEINSLNPFSFPKKTWWVFKKMTSHHSMSSSWCWLWSQLGLSAGTPRGASPCGLSFLTAGGLGGWVPGHMSWERVAVQRAPHSSLPWSWEPSRASLATFSHGGLHRGLARVKGREPRIRLFLQGGRGHRRARGTGFDVAVFGKNNLHRGNYIKGLKFKHIEGLPTKWGKWATTYLWKL